MKNTQKTGTLYVLIAAILFSIGGLCFKINPWPPLAINSARNMISASIVFLFIRASKHKIRINKTVLIGALCVTGTNNLYSLANKLTTAGNTIVLQFTAPIFIILLNALFFKIKPKKDDIIACVLVLVGIGFFVIDGLSAGNMLGNFLAIASGLSYAGVFMLNSFEQSDSLSSVLAGQCMSILIGLPFLLHVTEPTAIAIGAVLALGILQQGSAFVLLTKGLETTPAITASLITGIEPILNPLLVAVFYHEVLTPMSMVGAVIVFVTIILYNVQKGKQLPADAGGGIHK